MVHDHSVHFDMLKLKLTAELHRTFEGFVAKHGKTEFDRAKLYQMPMTVDEFAGQVLMFGGDIWPAEGMLDEPAAVPSSTSTAVSAMLRSIGSVIAIGTISSAASVQNVDEIAPMVMLRLG